MVIARPFAVRSRPVQPTGYFASDIPCAYLRVWGRIIAARCVSLERVSGREPQRTPCQRSARQRRWMIALENGASTPTDGFPPSLLWILFGKRIEPTLKAVSDDKIRLPGPRL